MDRVKPDLIARVRLYSEEEGGRKSPTPPVRIGCIFEYEGDNFDCLLLLEETGPLHPGSQATVPIKFLHPDFVKDRLTVGRRFLLKDFRTIAEGEVQEVCG